MDNNDDKTEIALYNSVGSHIGSSKGKKVVTSNTDAETYALRTLKHKKKSKQDNCTFTRPVLRRIKPSVFHTAVCLISDFTDSFSLERISSSSSGSSSLSELFSDELSSIRH